MLVQRLQKKIKSDPKKVVLQYFNIGNLNRIKNVLSRINSLSEFDLQNELTEIENKFEGRHKFFREIIYNNFLQVEKYLDNAENISQEKKLIIGAYFSKEYSIEAASLFNPSIVLHPDQSKLKPKTSRFLLSLRATGEGHISSIEFKTGIIDEKNEIIFDLESKYSTLPQNDNTKIFNRNFIKENVKFADNDLLINFPETFTYEEVKIIINKFSPEISLKYAQQIADILDIADSNYKINFSHKSEINERVIFPLSKMESHGLEDLRLVKFSENNGENIFYGTYTAYDGYKFRTQLLETINFSEFEIHTLHGAAIQDKGMALFPRKINGKYVITSRQGGENIQIMYSDNLYKWEKFEQLQTPKESWQFVQLGNCGSPIETDEGWLLITHAVGKFREYSIGALLLDLDNPSKVIGSLKTPLLEPNAEEREGYVPNVLYSCGSLVHNENLIIPYAMSDSYTGFAKVNLSDLTETIKNGN